MQSKTQLQQLISLYQLTFTSEHPELNELIQFLHTTADNQLYDRKNFNGHITTSAFILNENKTALLLINHKKLNRWLQPGGHADLSDESLLASALRETREETGLLPEHMVEITVAGKQSIFDIDSHYIPANTTKNEPAHTHHDVRFLFNYTGPLHLTLNPNEATAFNWVPLAELKNDSTFKKIAEKIRDVIAKPPVSSFANRPL